MIVRLVSLIHASKGAGGEGSGLQDRRAAADAGGLGKIEVILKAGRRKPGKRSGWPFFLPERRREGWQGTAGFFVVFAIELNFHAGSTALSRRVCMAREGTL